MAIRQDLERLELETLSPKATLSIRSKGRLKTNTPCDLRTAFQRDRDRIQHSRAFARLKDKMQVLISDAGKCFQSRLMHTIRVAQISRTIARGLLLNEDLTEAIAMGHDLGHPPFGHIGEYVLNSMDPRGFDHARYGLRIVEELESQGEGLNLTHEVKDGIVKHSKTSTPIIPEDQSILPESIEGQIVRISDSIVSVNYDIEDCLKTGILRHEDLPPESLDILGYTSGKRLDVIISDIITETTNTDLERIAVSTKILKLVENLRKFLRENYYLTPEHEREVDKVKRVFKGLHEHFSKYPESMDLNKFNMKRGEYPQQLIWDYIACMTDKMALEFYTQIFTTPKGRYDFAIHQRY